MSKYRLIIFDFDGTLADSAQGIICAMNKTLESFGMELLPAAKIIDAVGNGMTELINRLVTTKMPLTSMGEFRQLFKKNYSIEQRHNTFLYPQVLETLSILVHEKQIKIAIISNKPAEILQEIFTILQLERFPWVAVAGADTFARQKPDPLPLLEVIKRAQVTTRDVLMVGDGLPDFFAAQNARIDFLGVSFGLSGIDKLLAHGAESYIDHFADLLLKI